MIAAPNGSKLIFTVFLHRHSPSQFSKLREQRFERTYANPDLRERYRGEFDTSDPAVHRYNDIAGYGEVYWDGGTRILVEIFFRGDRRRKFGQAVAAGRRPQIVSASSFYPLYVQGVEAGEFPHASCCDELKRQAIKDALERVRTVGADMGCFVDMTNEAVLLAALDVGHLLSP